MIIIITGDTRCCITKIKQCVDSIYILLGCLDHRKELKCTELIF
jgi:hypothetical protein